MLIRYGIPRAWRSLSLNWRASLNSVLIIAASLAVLGMGVLLYLNVMQFSRMWLANTTVSLFLSTDLNDRQRQELLAIVRADPAVEKAALVSPQEGMAALGKELGTDHGLLEGVDASHLPYSIDFDVALDYREKLHLVVARFISVKGVDEVIYAERALDEVRLFFAVTRGVGLFFVTLIIVSFFMVVSNAIKLSLHTRLEEIEILSAVGATHRVIRSSFIVEGTLLALGGFVVAVGFIGFGYELIIAAMTWDETTLLLRDHALFFSVEMLAAGFVLAGVLGGIGSRVSVNRLLRGLSK